MHSGTFWYHSMFFIFPRIHTNPITTLEIVFTDTNVPLCFSALFNAICLSLGEFFEDLADLLYAETLSLDSLIHSLTFFIEYSSSSEPEQLDGYSYTQVYVWPSSLPDERNFSLCSSDSFLFFFRGFTFSR